MAYNFQNICGTFLLCIVILFVTGVVFPKYIVSQNLKERAIFNSSVAVFKLVSKEHLVSNQTDFGKSIDSSNITSKETESSPRSSFLQSIAFDRLQTPGKGKRLKRHTTSQDDLKEVFSWNFNLNVSRVEKTALHKVSKNKSLTSDRKKLGVAVYASNQETVLSELQRTLDSVTSFLKDVFGSGTKNGTHDFKGMNKEEIRYPNKESPTAVMQDHYIRSNTEKGKEQETISRNPLTESFQDVSHVSEFETGQNLSSLNLDSGSKNDSSVTKGRKGRIFFDIFGLGGKLLGRTSSVSEDETTTISMDGAQTETNVMRSENLPIHVIEKPERFTENSNQEATFNSDSLESSVIVPVKDSTADIANMPSQQTTQLFECPGCVTDSLGFQFIPNKVEEETKDTVSETTDSTASLFTDEELENFCKTLPNDLGQSHPSQLTDEVFETDSTMADSFLVNAPTTEFPVHTDKESRFFSLFETGSGRSEITSDKDLKSFGQVNEFAKFPSVLDCLQFFSKKRDTFIKPNDINDTESSTFSNFEHTPVVPNFEEQQLQFSSNSSVQTLDEISEGTETHLGKSITLLDDGNDFTVKDLSGKQETNFEPNDFNLSNKLEITESTESEEVEKTSDDRRDGKFLSFFGFGSGSDVQENGSLSERFFNSFFSSGARSLESFDGLEETFDLGSGNSLDIESFSGDGTVLLVSDRDLSEDASITSVEPRFLSFLGFAGSGDGRELTENSELIVTEFSNRVDNECGNCSQDVKKQLYKCDDYECNFESVHDQENIDTSESVAHISFNESGCDDCYSNDELLNKDISISSSETSNPDRNITVYFDEKPEKCNCFRSNNKNEGVSKCDCDSDSLQPSDDPYIDPEHNFSTEIHLSKDPTGINEYENCNDCDHKKNENPILVTPLLETSGLIYKTNADEMTYRNNESRSHLNELDNIDFTTSSLEPINTDENLQQEHKTTIMNPRRFMGTIFLTGSGDGGLFGDDSGPINLEEEERTLNPLLHSRRRGRFEDFPIDSSCDDCGDLSDVIQERDLEETQTNQTENPFNSSPKIEFGDNVPKSPISKSKGEVTTLKENITNIDNITSRPVITSNEPSPSSNVPLDRQYRPCVAARDCNVTLDERCIRINSSSVCECGRTFVRQKLTGKCVAKGRTETSLKLPAEMFHSDLRDPKSARYKRMTENSIDTMWLLLDETPDVRQIVTEVNVSKFTAGSLIISMYLVLAVENETEILNGLEGKLQKALLDENVVKKASLNIRNATVLSVFNELDPCKSAELNYCSRNAYCKRTEDSQRSYTCVCKEHFTDASSDPLFPGEKCIENCPPKYCGPNGHCEIIENERHCLCNGMYFGERCEVPGMVILGSLTVTAIVTLMVLCAVVIKLRCRKTSYGGSPTFHRNEDIGPHVIANGRVSDAIALAENPGAKISKFGKISTPLPLPPVIKVTRPTINDSVISFDCDSTFDVTPTSEPVGSTGS